MNVLILCAGYGTRLAPLTDQIPKPLVQVGAKTMLQHQCDMVREAFPKSNIYINAHHLAQQLQTVAPEYGISKVFEEPKILGTGGPLRRLIQEGYDDDLLVLNCDTLHNVPLFSFVQQAQQAGNFALYCVNNPSVNSLQIGQRVQSKEASPHEPNTEHSHLQVLGVDKVYSGEGTVQSKATFTGISWYSKQSLHLIQPEHFSIVTFWKQQASQHIYPTAVVAPEDLLWIDIGSPQGLWQANQLYAQNNQNATQNNCSTNHPNTIFQGESIVQNAVLESCLVLDGAKVPDGKWQKVIFGRGFQWQL
jgi:N-acetyl-alpha-D-muramate 1-phosphate uridylyltransferase